MSRFSEWWQKYPRKVGKAKCLRFWKSHKLDKKADELIEKLDQQLAWQYCHTERRFIPHPYTYLNQERWEDEVEQIHVEDTMPKENEKLVAWALENGKRGPRPGETYAQYRKALAS